MNAKFVPFEKRTKKEQRQNVANRLLVWTRIAAQDCERLKFEELLAHTGIHNAHVIRYATEQMIYSSSVRRETIQLAEQIELLTKHS